VRSTPDERLGVAAMLALERQARRARRGIWAAPAYAVVRADAAAKFAGTFQLMRGTVLDVAKSSRGVMLSFGADRRRALAALIGPPALKLFRKAKLDPRALKGRRVLLRGFIDGKTPPLLLITHPEQIELLDAGQKKTAPADAPEP
jgi:hypothetical protein